jgi:hypothetical protein
VLARLVRKKPFAVRERLRGPSFEPLRIGPGIVVRTDPLASPLERPDDTVVGCGGEPTFPVVKYAGEQLKMSSHCEVCRPGRTLALCTA